MLGGYPMHSRRSSSKLLSQLPIHKGPRQDTGAISLAAGLVTSVVLVLGATAMVQLSGGNLRGVFASSEARQARSTAEEGSDQLINSWNQPQNRKLLVSGADPGSWSASDANLRSPCFNTASGGRPGPNNGLPDAAAIALGDGSWRDVVTGNLATATQDGRQYRLVGITYSASNGSTNPNTRALSRTAVPGGGIAGSALPSGFSSWDQLVNLTDPDGPGDLGPGRNSGFILLQVEGRVVRGGRVVANSRISREFEVLPKCCGASLGSNLSGGVNYAGTSGSLGSDSRLCNLQYAISTGFNDGWHWSFFANDRFTQLDPVTGNVVDYSPILGVIPSQGNLFQRSNCRVRPAAGCARTDDPNDDDDGNDNSFASTIASGSPTPGTPPCRQTGPSSYYAGPQTDRDGTTASCVPIIPFEASNFPPISNFDFTWTAGAGPSQILTQAASTSNKLPNAALWPRLSTDNNDSNSNANSDASLRLRTRSDVVGAERVEVCLTDLAADTGSPNSDDCTADTWLSVTSQGSVNLATFYADNFDGSTPGGATAWAGVWNFSGNAAIASNRLDLPADTTAARPANTSGLTVPYLSFLANRTSNWDGDADFLDVEASIDGTKWFPVARLFQGNISTSGSTILLALPFTNSNFQIRFNTESLEDGNTERAFVDNIRIESGRPTISRPSNTTVDTAFRGAWCEYSSNSPVSAQPGFHCLGPTFNQFDGGKVFIDTHGGPLSFYYTAPETTDRRNGGINRALPENFIYLSRSPAELAHVDCGALRNDCQTPVDDSVFSPVGEPDRLNFFGRDTGTAGNEQNIRINTTFGNNSKIAGVWFYLPRGRVELRVNGGQANSVPPGFYTDDDSWSFSGRIWVSQFKPYGAFHLRVPDSRLSGSFGETGQARYVNWNGIDWVARATTNSRLW